MAISPNAQTHTAPADPPSVIVLAVDRLSPGALGSYGNTSIDTPEIDRWAAAGVLFDQVIANSIDLKSAYQAYWSDEFALGDACQQANLVTDDPAIANHPGAESFDEVQLIEPPVSSSEPAPGTAKAASTAADTQLAHFFAHAIDALSNPKPGTLLWLHSRGMSDRWDAPADYRQNQCGPDDPSPPEFLDAPSQWVEPATADPDELLGLEQSYAAQVILLDQLLTLFGETVRQSPKLKNTWLILTSPRGYALGQHGIVGDAADPSFAGTALHQENVHVPLIACPPPHLKNQLSACRCGLLGHPSELSKLLVEVFQNTAEAWLNNRLSQSGDSPNTHVTTVHQQTAAVQTSQWKLITDGQQHRLYAKPDDRWEVNDVADRCPVELTEMQQRLAAAEQRERPPALPG